MTILFGVHVDEILTQYSDIDMASFYVGSLFKNIPLNESIDICINKLFQVPGTLVLGK